MLDDRSNRLEHWLLDWIYTIVAPGVMVQRAAYNKVGPQLLWKKEDGLHIMGRDPGEVDGPVLFWPGTAPEGCLNEKQKI